MIGEAIAHYQITEKIGEGGMGEVYMANSYSCRDWRFGITHDSGSASDSISNPLVWIPELQPAFVPSETNAFDVRCSNPGTQLTSSPSRLPSRTITGPNTRA